MNGNRRNFSLKTQIYSIQIQKPMHPSDSIGTIRNIDFFLPEILLHGGQYILEITLSQVNAPSNKRNTVDSSSTLTDIFPIAILA